MARGSQSIRGKTVLITGAARGIGAETARRLAARGAKLSLVGLEPELLEAVAADCGDAAGSRRTSPIAPRSRPLSRARSTASAGSTP